MAKGSGYLCTATWSMCAQRSGKGHSNPHQCGEYVPAGENHPTSSLPHRCSACGERKR
jgi:hypothetical protein